jgi:hypothetical protein
MPRLLTFTSHRHFESPLRTPCEKRGHSIMSDVPSARDCQPLVRCAQRFKSARKRIPPYSRIRSYSIQSSNSHASSCQFCDPRCCSRRRDETRRDERQKNAVVEMRFLPGIFASLPVAIDRYLARIARQTTCAERDNSRGSEFYDGHGRALGGMRRPYAGRRTRNTIEISAYHRAIVMMILAIGRLVFFPPLPPPLSLSLSLFLSLSPFSLIRAYSVSFVTHDARCIGRTVLASRIDRNR